jgi:hypothetical protein
MIHLLLCEMIEIGIGKDLIWIQVELEQQFLGPRIIKINNTRNRVQFFIIRESRMAELIPLSKNRICVSLYCIGGSLNSLALL